MALCVIAVFLFTGLSVCAKDNTCHTETVYLPNYAHATPGCGHRWDSFWDGPSTGYIVNENKSGIKIYCELQSDDCYSFGFDCDKDSWYVDIYMGIRPISSHDAYETIIYDPDTGLYVLGERFNPMK